MKLAFSHYEDLISADCQVVVEIFLEWDGGDAILQVDDVLDSTGKVSLFQRNDVFWEDFAGRIAEAAENSESLRERAIAQWDDEREEAA